MPQPRALSSLVVAFCLAMVASAGVSACGGVDATAPEAAKDAVATGAWGGAGVALEVAAAGAKVEFDCAHGAITEPLVLDAARRFDVAGRFVQEHGGPEREGEDQAGEPARYSGTVDGKTLTLTVVLSGDDRVGPFTLVQGQSARLHKCL